MATTTLQARAPGVGHNSKGMADSGKRTRPSVNNGESDVQTLMRHIRSYEDTLAAKRVADEALRAFKADMRAMGEHYLADIMLAIELHKDPKKGMERIKREHRFAFSPEAQPFIEQTALDAANDEHLDNVATVDQSD
jgi:hypothetical protein